MIAGEKSYYNSYMLRIMTSSLPKKCGVLMAIWGLAWSNIGEDSNYRYSHKERMNDGL